MIPQTVRLVFDTESELMGSRLLGEWFADGESTVVYTRAGDIRHAPADCVEVATFHAQPFADRAKLVVELTPSDDRLAQLRDVSTPAPGRDGVRIDGNGREWYSASWLGLRS